MDCLLSTVRAGPLSVMALNTLKRVLDGDKQCSYFFDNYGHTSSIGAGLGRMVGVSQSNDGEYATQDAETSKYLVANVNRLGEQA